MLPKCFHVWQGRINHCADCTMGAPRRQGAPDQLPNFYHAVSMFEIDIQCICLNVTTILKTFWEKSAPPEKILDMRMRKEPPPYVRMGQGCICQIFTGGGVRVSTGYD